MKELTKKCIGLISTSLVQLGQTKSKEDILVLSTTLAEDLMRDFNKMSFKDIEEAFRTGIRETEEFSLNVKTYYKWIRAQKKLIDEDIWAKNNQEHYTSRKELTYRSKNNTGLLTINKLLNGNRESKQTKKTILG
tara:strand:- start:411 stop:815 length:405 start_codon:yes stop_codon:yes gene_type:complete